MPRTDKSVRQWKAKLKKYPVLFNGCDCSTCGAGHVYTYEKENNKFFRYTWSTHLWHEVYNEPCRDKFGTYAKCLDGKVIQLVEDSQKEVSAYEYDEWLEECRENEDGNSFDAASGSGTYEEQREATYAAIQ